MLVCSCAESVLADYIILFSLPAAEETALDDFNDEGCCLFLAHLRVEASSNEKKQKTKRLWSHGTEVLRNTYILEKFNGLSSEAWQSSVQHQGYQGNHCIHVGASI